MNHRNLFRLFLDPWVIVGAIAIGVILFATVLIVLLITRPFSEPVGVPTAAITLVSIPTGTSIPTNEPLESVTPTLSPAVTPQPGEIYPGAFVKITGTGGDGLRLRMEPGLESEILWIGEEAEVLSVQDGPVEADGFTWWLLVSSADNSRQGWAVSDYLIVVDTR
jgi:hypothetical protein